MTTPNTKIPALGLMNLRFWQVILANHSYINVSDPGVERMFKEMHQFHTFCHKIISTWSGDYDIFNFVIPCPADAKFCKDYSYNACRNTTIHFFNEIEFPSPWGYFAMFPHPEDILRCPLTLRIFCDVPSPWGYFAMRLVENRSGKNEILIKADNGMWSCR